MSNNNLLEFTEWLNKELEKRNMKPNDLTRGGISASTISRIFSGERMPGLDALIGISEALRLPRIEVFQAAGLLGREGTKEYSEEVEKFAHMIAMLPSEDQEIIDAFIQTMIDRRRGKDLEGPAPANQPVK